MNWKAWVSAFLLVFAAPAAADPPAPGNILLREIPYPLRVRVAAACAGTATLGLVGDPGVTAGALKSTAR
jgi:hypothetical protein